MIIGLVFSFSFLLSPLVSTYDDEVFICSTSALAIPRRTSYAHVGSLS